MLGGGQLEGAAGLAGTAKIGVGRDTAGLGVGGGCGVGCGAVHHIGDTGGGQVLCFFGAPATVTAAARAFWAGLLQQPQPQQQPDNGGHDGELLSRTSAT